MKRDWNRVFSMIGERYLDTQHSTEYIQRIELRLKEFGIVGVKRWLLEYVAASAFWWNFLIWEWVELNGRDVITCWLMNLIVFGVVSLMIGFASGVQGFLITFLILHILTTWLGFGLRAGSMSDE